MDRTIATADEYFSRAKSWHDEVAALREVVRALPLEEVLRWASPCYRFDGHNVVLINRFKEYCALSFFKGAMLDDPEGLLDAPGENTRAARLIRFTSVDEVARLAPATRALVEAAIGLEKAGKSVDFSKGREVDPPEELLTAFEEDDGFREAFEALTPGRRRAWLLHFTGAKQSKTRADRIAKAAPKIRAGKGPQDR